MDDYGQRQMTVQELRSHSRSLGEPKVRQTQAEESTLMIHPLVSVVDDDESVRESLPDLLREFATRRARSRRPRNSLSPVWSTKPSASYWISRCRA